MSAASFALICLRVCFPGGSDVKTSPANAGNAGDEGSIPELGRHPRGGNGNPLQYSCLGNPMDRGAWQATVMESQNQAQLSMHEHSEGAQTALSSSGEAQLL